MGATVAPMRATTSLAVTVFTLALLPAGCSSPGPNDGGTAGGSTGGGAATAGGTATAGGGAGGGESLDAGADVYVADGGLAYLVVPLGAAPRDAGIRLSVGADDAGNVRTVTLEPSGLQFSRPVLLAVLNTGWEPRGDAGFIGTVPASLGPSAHGGVERVRSVQVTAGAPSGFTPGVTLVRVTHFSQVILGEQNGPFPWIEAELDVGGGASPGFTRPTISTWQASVTFVHRDPTGFVPMVMGSFRISTAGGVQLANATDGDVKNFIGMTGAPGTFAFQLRCVTPGPAAVVLEMSSPALEQGAVFAASGLCEPALLAQVLVPPMTAPPVPGNTEVAAAIVTQVDEAVTGTPAAPAPNAGVGLSDQDKFSFTDRLARALDRRPPVTSSMQLMCTVCPVMTPLTGRGHATNVSPIPWKVQTVDVPTEGVVTGNGGGASVMLFPAQSVDLSFEYVCSSGGTGAVGHALLVLTDQPSEAVFARAQRVVTTDAIGRSRIPIECVDGLKGDAVMLSDNTRLTRSGGQWAAMPVGVTANVIHAHADLDPLFHPLAPGGLVYGGVSTFRSNGGLTPITLRSGRQTGTATFAAGRYTIAGLAAGAAFNSTDTLTVEHQPASGPLVSVSVPAPTAPPANPNMVFGPPAGFDTPITLPDGTFDTLYVFLLLRAPGATPPPGEFAVMLFRSASSLTLSNGSRVANLVDGPGLALLRELGWSVQTAYVAAFNTSQTSLFFPGLRAVPVQAGRMFQLSGADLGL